MTYRSEVRGGRVRWTGAWIGVVTVIPLTALLLSCGAGASLRPELRWARVLPDDLPLAGALSVRPDERVEPALELRLPWFNPSAYSGYGAIHLWARPALDHVRVSAIIDSPADSRRWGACERVAFQAGTAQSPLSARYVGRPMRSGGSYEAVQVQFGIHQLRRLAWARRTRVDVCGDALELTAGQRRTLRRFVEWFDHIATSRHPGDVPYFRDVGPRPMLPGEDAKPGLLEG